MSGGYLDQTLCSNSYCLRPKNLPIPESEILTEREMIRLLRIKKTDAFRDVNGNYWCQECKWRGELMDWGKAHNWPAIQCLPYAVAQGEQFWKPAIMIGNDSYAQALYDAIQIAEEI